MMDSGPYCVSFRWACVRYSPRRVSRARLSPGEVASTVISPGVPSETMMAVIMPEKSFMCGSWNDSSDVGSPLAPAR